MTQPRLPASAATIVLALLFCGCGAAAPAPTGAMTFGSELHIFAEGPCPKLSLQAIGEERFIVYGDTGYDLGAWMPGDELPAAQAIVEVKADRAFARPALLRGLPVDARGYVRGSLQLGGASSADGWLRRITTRYERSSKGALFERRATGYRWQGAGWIEVADGATVSRPPQARGLPALVGAEMCPKPELSFVPMATATSPSGGLFIAGRCDDEGPTNYLYTTIVVAHGIPQAKQWTIARLPDAEALDGIVNIDIFARSDAEAYLVAYEPFEKRDERQTYLARYDGDSWRQLQLSIDDGLMSVAGTANGNLWLAGGRRLYRRTADGDIAPVALPLPRYAKGSVEDLHVHTVHAPGGNELWVEASYRVAVPGPKGRAEVMWASALLSNRRTPHPLYCDAREPAEEALYEVQ